MKDLPRVPRSSVRPGGSRREVTARPRRTGVSPAATTRARPAAAVSPSCHGPWCEAAERSGWGRAVAARAPCRAIRAAFEKEAARKGARPGSSQEPETREMKTKTKSPCLEYTRDLFLCARFVARRRPELGEDRRAARVAAVHGPRARSAGRFVVRGGERVARRLKEAAASGDD